MHLARPALAGDFMLWGKHGEFEVFDFSDIRVFPAERAWFDFHFHGDRLFPSFQHGRLMVRNENNQVQAIALVRFVV